MALVRVLLADDHAGVLAYLRVRLGNVFDIIGAVEDGKQAIDATLRLDPDVVILDISMPVLNGFLAARRLHALKCRSKIVILTTYDDGEYISEAFSSGASAYVSKRCLGADLEKAISAVLHENTFISPSIADRWSASK